MFILPKQQNNGKRGSVILLDVENLVEDPQILGSPNMKRSGLNIAKKFKPLNTTGYKSDDGCTNERLSLPVGKSSFELDLKKAKSGRVK